MEALLISSIALQLLAGVLALRMFTLTDRNWAWWLLSAGIFLMAFRRIHTLNEFLRHDISPDLVHEILGLGISILILLGVCFIWPLLRDMRDATKRHAENEERFRTVAMFTHDWEYWLSPDGHYLYVSPACERISGYTADEFMADPDLFFRLVHPEDREEVETRMAKLGNMHTATRFDCRILTKEGWTRWIVHNTIPVISDNGTFLGIRGSVRDISHRKRLEAQLKKSQAMYRELVENSRSMVLRLDKAGRVTYVCGYALDHFNTPGDAILGKGLKEVFTFASDAIPDEAAERIDAFLAEGEPLELEIDIRQADGMILWAEWVGSAVRDENGDIDFFICVGLNVTRRKALDKLKEDMSRIVRHDLKSPLSGIIGIPSVMKEDENLTPRQVELLKAVEDAGNVMLQLINQSLNLYKLETGTYEFELSDFDLREMIGNIADHMQAGRKQKIPILLSDHGNPIDNGHVIPMRSDHPLVFSLLSNLIKNAIEASENQPVSVDLMCDGDCVVTIQNAGVVPEAIRETFFDKYVTNGKYGGTGLGTYSARLIADQLNGNITMQSSAAEGTTITVTLPNHAQRHTADSASSAAAPYS